MQMYVGIQGLLLGLCLLHSVCFGTTTAHPAAPPRESPSPAVREGAKGGAEGKEIPVYMVEQHGEVLHYWKDHLDARSEDEKSRFPKVNLSHVDSHIDVMDAFVGKR